MRLITGGGVIALLVWIGRTIRREARDHQAALVAGTAAAATAAAAAGVVAVELMPDGDGHPAPSTTVSGAQPSRTPTMSPTATPTATPTYTTTPITHSPHTSTDHAVGERAAGAEPGPTSRPTGPPAVTAPPAPHRPTPTARHSAPAGGDEDHDGDGDRGDHDGDGDHAAPGHHRGRGCLIRLDAVTLHVCI